MVLFTKPKTITAMTQLTPVLVPFSHVTCSADNACTHENAPRFNSFRAATFNMAQRKYAEIERNITHRKPGTIIDSKIIRGLKNHKEGIVFEEFSFKCGVCNKRNIFKVNTLTGDVIDTNGISITDAPYQPISIDQPVFVPDVQESLHELPICKEEVALSNNQPSVTQRDEVYGEDFLFERHYPGIPTQEQP